MCVCVRACVRACMRVHACVCVFVLCVVCLCVVCPIDSFLYTMLLCGIHQSHIEYVQ